MRKNIVLETGLSGKKAGTSNKINLDKNKRPVSKIETSIVGFTLVELIVVITILAILGTIAIMAFGGYSKNARDSRRTSDLNNITKVLELFKLKTGTYPSPTDTFAVTYSGATAWTQGNFGDATVTNVATLDKKPVDPLTGSDYTYSVTNTKGEFQVAVIYEGDNLSANGFINQTYAAEEMKAIIKGTYNGKFVKTNSGSTTFILGAPSIITSEITSVDIETITTNKSFVYTNYSNLPSSYKSTAYTMTGGFEFEGGAGVVLFEGDITTLGTSTGKLAFANNLNAYYSVPPLDTNGDYKEITELDILNNQNGAITLINSYLSNKVAGIIADQSNLLDEVVVIQWKDLPGTNCDKDDYVFTLSGTTYRWAGCNSVLGDTGVTTNENIYNGTCYNYAGSSTLSNCNSTYLTYIAKENQFNATNGEDNIWGKLYLWDNAVQSNNACPTGWHLSTDDEWEKLETYLNGGVNCRNGLNGASCSGLGWSGKSSKDSSNNIIKALNLPLAGNIYNDGTIWFLNRGGGTSLWSSTDSGGSAYRRYFVWNLNTVDRNLRDKVMYGFSVRCVKD